MKGSGVPRHVCCIEKLKIDLGKLNWREWHELMYPQNIQRSFHTSKRFGYKTVFRFGRLAKHDPTW
jgi:hypothetical protein